MAKGNNSFRKRHPLVVRGLLLFFTFVVASLFGVAYGTWVLICRGQRCPTVEALNDYTPRQTSKLYAVDGRFIAELGNERRTLVKLDEIPPHVQQAFVITEDKRFYSHAGVDWIRVFGALARDVVARGWEQGFSTITMQLARNVFPERLSREKTLVRKMREAKVARAIEEKYDKKKILELYLNQITLGNGAFGVEVASQRYFGKSVRDLNIAEAATLAALPKAPERYNPRRHPDRAIQRRNTVIDLMRENGAISAADASVARAYPLQLASRTESGDVAPYFVEWIRQQLDEQFGKQLYEQGLKVFTTLDLDMQSAAERAMERQLRLMEAGRYGKFPHESYEHYIARSLSGSEAPDNSIRMTDLAESLKLSPSGITRRIDGLVRDGYVERRPCPSDRRGSNAVLTETGLLRLEEAAPTHLRGVRLHFIDQLSERQLANLASALSAVVIDREAAAGGCDEAR